jgi:hypothetical protein
MPASSGSVVLCEYGQRSPTGHRDGDDRLHAPEQVRGGTVATRAPISVCPRPRVSILRWPRASANSAARRPLKRVTARSFERIRRNLGVRPDVSRQRSSGSVAPLSREESAERFQTAARRGVAYGGVLRHSISSAGMAAPPAPRTIGGAQRRSHSFLAIAGCCDRVRTECALTSTPPLDLIVRHANWDSQWITNAPFGP